MNYRETIQRVINGELPRAWIKPKTSTGATANTARYQLNELRLKQDVDPKIVVGISKGMVYVGPRPAKDETPETLSGNSIAVNDPPAFVVEALAYLHANRTLTVPSKITTSKDLNFLVNLYDITISHDAATNCYTIV